MLYTRPSIIVARRTLQFLQGAHAAVFWGYSYINLGIICKSKSCWQHNILINSEDKYHLLGYGNDLTALRNVDMTPSVKHWSVTQLTIWSRMDFPSLCINVQTAVIVLCYQTLSRNSVGMCLLSSVLQWFCKRVSPPEKCLTVTGRIAISV